MTLATRTHACQCKRRTDSGQRCLSYAPTRRSLLPPNRQFVMAAAWLHTTVLQKQQNSMAVITFFLVETVNLTTGFAEEETSRLRRVDPSFFACHPRQDLEVFDSSMELSDLHRAFIRESSFAVAPASNGWFIGIHLAVTEREPERVTICGQNHERGQGDFPYSHRRSSSLVLSRLAGLTRRQGIHK
jgi:hypothetical protein